MVRADSANVSWDTEKKTWQVRIQVGAEVIKRSASHIGKSHDADDEALRSAAIQIARDEGYEMDASAVTVSR